MRFLPYEVFYEGKLQSRWTGPEDDDAQEIVSSLVADAGLEEVAKVTGLCDYRDVKQQAFEMLAKAGLINDKQVSEAKRLIAHESAFSV